MTTAGSRTFEQLTNPFSVGYNALLKMGDLAFRGFGPGSAKLGERLSYEHERTQVAIGLGELRRAAADPQLKWLGGRMVLGSVARGLEGDERYTALDQQERVAIAQAVMDDHFPERSFDDFGLGRQQVATLRDHLPRF